MYLFFQNLPMGSRIHNTFRRFTFFFCFALTALGLLSTAPVQAQVEITSVGPLTKIGINPTGNLYAYHQLFGPQLYYGIKDASAAVWAVYDVDNNLLYGPGIVAAGGNMTGSAGYTAWTASTQTGPSGTGTAADPYKITTTLTTASGLTAVIIVTYEVGREFFNISLQVTDTSGTARNLRAFLGADLYYDGTDNGTPVYDPATGSVGGVGETTGFTGWFIPQTPAQHYFAGGYNTMWTQIGAHQLNSSVSAGPIDYAAALQWNIALPADGTTTIDTTQLFSGALTLLPPSLANGTVGVPYSQSFTPFGAGAPPYTLSFLSGNLPPGITFDPLTNTITGTPTLAGTYSFTLRVTDNTPVTPLIRDFPYTLTIVQGVLPSASQPVPALRTTGALVMLILALGIVASGRVRKKI